MTDERWRSWERARQEALRRAIVDLGMSADAARYLTATPDGPRPANLQETVAAQLAGMGVDLSDGPSEMPDPTPEEMQRYDVALDWATRHCDHSRSSTCTSYARGERQCDDCGRFFRQRRWFE